MSLYEHQGEHRRRDELVLSANASQQFTAYVLDSAQEVASFVLNRRQARKKCKHDFTLILHLQIWFKEYRKLCLNSCSRK